VALTTSANGTEYPGGAGVAGLVVAFGEGELETDEETLEIGDGCGLSPDAWQPASKTTRSAAHPARAIISPA
jgi:hypothetical protein